VGNCEEARPRVGKPFGVDAGTPRRYLSAFA